MPSTVVHCALAGLLAAALLGPAFDGRAVGLVLLAAIVPDLDVFAGFVVAGGHRAVLHTLLIPLLGATLLAVDLRRGERSVVRRRWGSRGGRALRVALVAYAVAGIGLDLFVGGANVLYPLHDQFYVLDGEFVYSTRRGLVQTFVEVGSSGVNPGAAGSTGEVHVSSGVDPTRGTEPPDVDREFPVVRSGWQLLLVLTSLFVLAARFWERR